MSKPKSNTTDGGDDLFLEISRTKSGRPLIAIHEGPDLLDSAARLSILINLSQILSVGEGRNAEDTEFRTIEQISTTDQCSAANAQESGDANADNDTEEDEAGDLK